MCEYTGMVGRAGMCRRSDMVSVRAELRQAKDVARQQDPSWLKVFWPMWLLLLAVGFAVWFGPHIVAGGFWPWESDG